MVFQAPRKEQQINSGRKYVDTRSSAKIIWASFTKFEIALIVNVTSCGIVFYKPWTFLFCLFAILIVTMRAKLSKDNKTLPVKLPIELNSKFTDWNAPYPGRKKYKKACGTVMIGNTRDTGGLEIWQEPADLLVHVLCIGTTGSGKTETLISMCGATCFSQAGGTFYIDPKAGNLLLIQFVTLCKIFGRIDDFRVMNYKTGGVSVQEKHYEKRTNSFNPFALGTDKNIFQILGGLLPEDAGQNQSFLNSAIELMKAVLPALCELRDRGYIQLTPGLLADYLSIKHLANLVRPEVLEDRANMESIVYDPTQEEGTSEIRVNLGRKNLRPLEMYFSTLGYDASKGYSGQPDNVNRSFGYAKSYYGEPLSNLAANFAHMYDHDLPEISLEDAIFNNRILLTLIPAMEFPPADQQNLGKITLSTVKQAMSLALGPQTEGDYTQVIENLPVDKNSPFILYLDEYPAISVLGFAVVATQARSLGVGAVFGAQDLDGLFLASEEEGKMIFANTLTKYLGRTQDPEKTWEMFKKLAGTMNVAESSNYGEAGALNIYKKEISASIKEVDRLHQDDVFQQIEGEFHLFERGNVHKINTFYHALPESLLKQTEFRYNRLLPVLAPSDKDIEIIDNHLKSITRLKNAYASGTVYPDIEAINFTSILESESPTGGIFIDTIKKRQAIADPAPQSTIEDNLSQIDEQVSINNVEASSEPTTSTAIEESISEEIEIDFSEDIESNVNELREKIQTAHEPADEKQSIHDVLSMSENHWIYESIEGENDQSIADILTENIQSLNNAILGDNADNSSVSDLVDGLSSELPYTSKPEVECKPTDTDLAWNLLNNL